MGSARNVILENLLSLSQEIAEFMVPKDMLSFPQVTATPDFSIMFRCTICVVTAIIVNPPLSCLHIRGLPHIGRPQQLLQHTPCTQLPLKFGSYIVMSLVFPVAVSMWLVSIWSGAKARFETPVNICWYHKGGNQSIIVLSIHRRLKNAVVCLADGRSVSVLMVNVWVESCGHMTGAAG
jgi:hypothetical protein